MQKRSRESSKKCVQALLRRREPGAGPGRALRWLIACSALLAAPAFAQDAAAWLARMQQALGSQHYQGTFAYMRDGQLDAMQVYHRGGPAPRERLLTLSGELREMVRSADAVRLGQGVHRTPTLPDGSGIAAATALDPAQLAAVYDLRIGGMDRVAGRPAQLLELRPRDAFRYGYRYALDVETGLPLRAMVFGADGLPVEQWMFTTVTIGTEPAEADLGTPSPVAAEAPQVSDGPAAWQVVDAPRGFSLLRSMQQASVTHLVFGDGVAKVSVYVEPFDVRSANLSGVVRRGALSVFGRVLGDQQITVVGEVPAATAERFAQGVIRAGG